jgi:hypothetical protein
MNTKLSIVMAIIVICFFPALALYASQSQPPIYNEQQAIEMAKHFLVNSPTFRFDGITNSINVVGVDELEELPILYRVRIEFECSHSGYGDRTGMILLQVITTHEIVIDVENGKVIGALIDYKWDELGGFLVAEGGILQPEDARDLVVAYVLNNYPGFNNIKVPAAWDFEIITGGLLGYQTIVYTGEGWTVKVSHAVVLEPIYTVEVTHEDVDGFQWIGEVDQSKNISGGSQNQQQILSPEEARYIAVDYVLLNYRSLSGVNAPENWETNDLTPQGLVGYSKLEYTADGWNVTVSYPVVWKPTYTVEITFKGATAFTWAGSVSQDGKVDVATP